MFEIVQAPELTNLEPTCHRQHHTLYIGPCTLLSGISVQANIKNFPTS